MEFSVTRVPINSLIFLAGCMGSCGCGRVSHLFSVCSSGKLRLFNPIGIRCGGNGSYVTVPVAPPMIRRVGKGCCVVRKGDQLACVAEREGLGSIGIVVIGGITTTLPSSGGFATGRILVSSSSGGKTSQFRGFSCDLCQGVRRAIQTPSVCIGRAP